MRYSEMEEAIKSARQMGTLVGAIGTALGFIIGYMVGRITW